MTGDREEGTGNSFDCLDILNYLTGLTTSRTPTVSMISIFLLFKPNSRLISGAGNGRT
ncbi:hypothetical protein PN451_03220 [Dolichospermum planctonicum CS-1226]|uniref:Uncharacterized protein n=1 Tax=Dolichospermum planctonicum CS-1226 TaxID=3021751 RepID=A0ABT5ACA4_9CYAN|nr:hypothetical protein [Dolichospermum planctonicum CS-1226]